MLSERSQKWLERMIDGAQPHCDEPVVSAMVCSHAGSMRSAVAAAINPYGGRLAKTSDLPNPVLIAVGRNAVYAFKYKPKGFKVKLKKGSEVARWPRSEIGGQIDAEGKVTKFSLVTAAGEYYALEVTTAMGGDEMFRHFFDALTTPAP